MNFKIKNPEFKELLVLDNTPTASKHPWMPVQHHNLTPAANQPGIIITQRTLHSFTHSVLPWTQAYRDQMCQSMWETVWHSWLCSKYKANHRRTQIHASAWLQLLSDFCEFPNQEDEIRNNIMIRL
jgi:hypothetical protein